MENGKVIGVQTYSRAIYNCKAVILCMGTYLNSRCIYGEISNETGPEGLQSANYVTYCLKYLGIEMYRFNTGTPARIERNSIDLLDAYESLGSITGETIGEDLVNEIFSKFCMGK